MSLSRRPLLSLRVRFPLLTVLTLLAALTFSGAAGLWAAEDLFLSAARQVTFEGRRAGEGYFSKDGKQLVFQSEREEGNPFFQIYLLDLETGDVELVSTGEGKTTCAWIHPVGDRVLFASTHADPKALDKQKEELELRASGKERRYSWDYDEHFDIWQRDLKSGDLKPLTRERGYDAEASWSPDGSLIAFSSNRHAYTEELSAEDQKRLGIDAAYFLDIYVAQGDGSNPRRLTEVPGYDGGPFFSPDGQRICWRRFSPDGATAEIHTMRTDGSDVRKLTQIGAMSWAPFYHPSGEYLIFTTNRHGFSNFELYLVDAAGALDPVRVTQTDGFDGLPVFHPDGEQLWWTSQRTPSKQSQIFAARWDHAAALAALADAPPRSEAASDESSVNESADDAPTADAAPKSRAEVAGSDAFRGALDAPTAVKIAVDDLRHHVELLASEELEGRMTGTAGELLATRYVAHRFEKLGLEPSGDEGSFYERFEFTAGVDLGEGNELTINSQTGDATASVQVSREDWVPLAYSANGEFESAEVVFAGYGIVAPGKDPYEEYDSYVHLDVEDKWVLCFRFLPEGITPEHRQHLARFASLRYKAMVARDKGARGLLVVSGPTSKVEKQLVRLGFDATLSGSSLPAISITDAVGEGLVALADRDLSKLQEALDGGKPQMGFPIPRAAISARIEIEKVRKEGRNVLARLVAEKHAGGPHPPPAIVVGAHVDHLGLGSSGSLAREDERGQIHRGADDNASGVASVLEIAEYLVGLQASGKLELERDVLFAAWSGEELGLLGSKHFVDARSNSAMGKEFFRAQFAACINLDMVGRLDKSLVLNGIGSSSIWRREVERRNAPIGLPITLSEDSYLPTDATSFYLGGVPILSAFTGSHGEYHSPRDTPDLLDYDSMAKISRLLALITRGLATDEEAPDFVQRAQPENRPRAGLRAYLGTIPDYGESPIKGLKISGAAKGGPADKAGLRGGDIIVELAGRKIENIYDYTYAIEALKIGDEVDIVVVRGEERKKLKITPGSRQ